MPGAGEAALAPAAPSRRSAYTRQYVLPAGAPPRSRIVLFYAYRHVASPESEADAHVALCARLQLTGRVLLAPEGINGTLSGADSDVEEYMAALCAHPLFRMQRTDFKASQAGWADPFSREMFVLVVPEIIASGGALAAVPLESVGQGYLTPAEWRDALSGSAQDDSTVVIDVRNRSEVALGRFAGAVDPKTRSFAEFPRWVQDNAELLRDKRVLMYCTGGVRCEKASAFVRAAGVAAEVRHLQGGIHRYIDAFGEDGLWNGRNFVFDRRGALGDGHDAAVASRTVVGRCVGCSAPWETLDGSAACTLCNEPLLACDACRAAREEHHCEEHAHLRRCFFRRLGRFSAAQLAVQLEELEALQRDAALSTGRRRTLAAQAGRVRERLQALQAGTAVPDEPEPQADAAPVAPPTLLWVHGCFPADAAAARLAWPCRIWPLSARPWAFIRDAPAEDGGMLTVDVECKIADDAYDAQLHARLAPQGRPARSRVWRTAWDEARGLSQVAVTLPLPVSDAPEEQATQRKLHLRWLGFEQLEV